MAGREGRSGVDPDAMWKPGYADGEPVAVAHDRQRVDADAPVDPVVESPGGPRETMQVDGLELYVPAADVASARPARGRALGVAVAAVVGIAVIVGGVALTRSEPSDGTTPLPHIADRIDVGWTASLAGEAGSVAAVRDLVVVSSADRAATVTAFDASSGAERWTARLGRRDSLGEMFVVGDAIAATTTGRIPSLQLIDATTGDTRWERRLRTDDSVVEIDGTIAVIDSVGGDLRVTALDMSTGAPLGSIEDPTSFGDGAYVRVDGTTVDVFDDALRPIATDVELGEVPVDVTLVGDVLLAIVSGRLRAVELDGRERWSMEIDAGEVRFVVASGAGQGQALLVSSTSTTAVDVRGAEPVVRWSVDGVPVVDPSAPGTRFAPLQMEGGALQVLDLEDGSVASTIDLAGGVARHLYGIDGVVLARPTGDDTWQLEGLDYRDGTVRWQAEVRGAPTLVERGVVGVRTVGDGLDVTYVGAG